MRCCDGIATPFPARMWSTVSAAVRTHALSPFDGAALSLAWGLPFAGLLLSIAFAPLLAPRLWHDHYGKCAAIWVLLLLVPFAATFGAGETLHNVAHAILLEYVPFLAMLFALFTIAGGICLRGTLAGTPAVNAGSSPWARVSRASWARPARRCC